MKKRYFLILSLILIFFISGCTGYKPLLNSSSLMIEIKNYTIEGDKESAERIYVKLANLLKSSNKENKKKIDLFLDTSKSKEPTIKDKSGKIIEYKITLNTILSVKSYETGSLIFSKNFTNSLSYKVQNQYSESVTTENKAVDNLINQTYQELLVTLIQNIT